MARSWMQRIVSGAALVLLLAVTAAFILAHRARAEAAKYVRLVAPLRIGTAYDASVVQLRAAGVPTTLPTDCGHECTLRFFFGNKWQHALHLAPLTELVGRLDFRDEMLVYKLTTMGQGIYMAEVAESASNVSRTSTNVDSLGRLRRISIELSALDFTEYRKRALAFNLACIGSMVGCKTDEFLPTADDLEHETPSSIPVHDLSLKGETLDVVSNLAEKYHVLIGVYGAFAGDYHGPTIDISVKNGTLGEAFDAITKADPQVEWHQGRGAVHFVSRNFPVHLMDVTVHSFDSDSDPRSNILDLLDDTPEIHGWLLSNKCHPANRRAIAFVGGSDITPSGYISVHTRDLPYSLILDEIAAKSRINFWSVMWSSTSPCPMYSEWRSQRR